VVVDDWALPEGGVREFALSDERGALLARYEGFAESKQLRHLLEDVERNGGDRCLIEAPYVDFDYRAEYSNLYAREFNPPSDKCERLLFFAGDTLVGFIVARPSPKPVGRSAISPPESLRTLVTCCAQHRVRPAGDQYTVEAYPFLTQDGQYGRCAHAAVWSVARYHHHRFGAGRHSIASVVEAAGARQSVDRTLASGGLGLPVLSYDPGRLPQPDASRPSETLEDIVCRYLDSGFPVTVNTEAHLSVLVGYGVRGEDVCFVRADDNWGPYEVLWDYNSEHDRLKEWHMLMVPLPARLHVPGEYAEYAARQTARDVAGLNTSTLAFRQALIDGDLRARTYAINSADYKAALGGREDLTDELIHHHQSVPLSTWVWVTELQDARRTREQEAHVHAEFSGWAFAWLPGERAPRAREVDDDVTDSALPARRYDDG
jgi:hypothetical protein